MLYETLSQPYVFFILFLTGVLAGLFFDIANFTILLCNKNKVIQQIIYFFTVMISFTVFFVVNLNINYGQFRIYIFLALGIGFILERFTFGKLWTKLFNKCYNQIEVFRQTILSKLKKHGKEKK